MAASTLQPPAGVRDEDRDGPAASLGAAHDGVTGRPAPEGAALGVVDLARWLREQPRPDLAGVLPPGVDRAGVLPQGALASGALPPAVQAPPPDRRALGEGMRGARVGPAPDRRHPDLVGARTSVWSGGRAATPDERGTGLATLLVGQGVAQVRGLVPQAHLLVAPVDPAAPAGDEAVARAVRWAIGSGAHVVVLPFGRQRPGRRLTATLHGALALGVRVLAAAGDLGAEALAFPASVTGVVAVTAHDGTGLLGGCSRRADLSAPGTDVPAGGPTGPTLLSGCAVATVLAAGCHVAWRSVSPAAVATARG